LTLFLGNVFILGDIQFVWVGSEYRVEVSTNQAGATHTQDSNRTRETDGVHTRNGVCES